MSIMPPDWGGILGIEPKDSQKKNTSADGSNNGQTADITTQELQDIVDSVNANSQSKSTKSGSRSSSTGLSITPKESAYSQIDREMIALFGRRATAKEKAAFFKSLNTAERHYASVSSSSSTGKVKTTGDESSSSTSSSTDYAFDRDSFLFEFTANLASNYIKEGKPLGGKAADTYNNLKTYAAAMGVSDDYKTILKNTIKVIKGSSDENALKNDYRKRAISLYGGLADSLTRDPSLTVKEAASDYINIMSNMLDINSNSISLHDPTLSKSLNATKDGKPYKMNLNEFTSELRNDSRFQFSTMAHQEARDLAGSFAQAFGFGG